MTPKFLKRFEIPTSRKNGSPTLPPKIPGLYFHTTARQRWHNTCLVDGKELRPATAGLVRQRLPAEPCTPPLPIPPASIHSPSLPFPTATVRGFSGRFRYCFRPSFTSCPCPPPPSHSGNARHARYGKPSRNGNGLLVIFVLEDRKRAVSSSACPMSTSAPATPRAARACFADGAQQHDAP